MLLALCELGGCPAVVPVLIGLQIAFLGALGICGCSSRDPGMDETLFSAAVCLHLWVVCPSLEQVVQYSGGDG